MISVEALEKELPHTLLDTLQQRNERLEVTERERTNVVFHEPVRVLVRVEKNELVTVDVAHRAHVEVSRAVLDAVSILERLAARRAADQARMARNKRMAARYGAGVGVYGGLLAGDE